MARSSKEGRVAPEFGEVHVRVFPSVVYYSGSVSSHSQCVCMYILCKDSAVSISLCCNVCGVCVWCGLRPAGQYL